MRFVILYDENWFSYLTAWGNEKYSPNISNVDKIIVNLSKLGNSDCEEWRRNKALLEKAIAPVKLVENVYISVEKIILYGFSLMLSLRIYLSDVNHFHCDFVLNETLNFYDIYSVNKIPKSTINNVINSNRHPENDVKSQGKSNPRPSFLFEYNFVSSKKNQSESSRQEADSNADDASELSELNVDSLIKP